jgi:hypothetical protein
MALGEVGGHYFALKRLVRDSFVLYPFGGFIVEFIASNLYKLLQVLGIRYSPPSTILAVKVKRKEKYM